MKKSEIYSWLLAILFFGGLLLFVTSCSDSNDEIIISDKDWTTVHEMGINDNDVLIRIIESDSSILDLNSNPIVAGNVYVRTKGILQFIDLGNRDIELIITNSGDSTSRWILHPDIWVRSLDNISSWNSIVVEVLYLKDVDMSVDRSTYVTFIGG